VESELVHDLIQATGALFALLAAALGYLNRKKIGTVNDHVNSQADAQVARVDKLARALQHHGVDIPPRPEHDKTVPSVGESTSVAQTGDEGTPVQ
jgi:hypothetical protein